MKSCTCNIRKDIFKLWCQDIFENPIHTLDILFRLHLWQIFEHNYKSWRFSCSLKHSEDMVNMFTERFIQLIIQHEWQQGRRSGSLRHIGCHFCRNNFTKKTKKEQEGMGQGMVPQTKREGSIQHAVRRAKNRRRRFIPILSPHEYGCIPGKWNILFFTCASLGWGGLHYAM